MAEKGEPKPAPPPNTEHLIACEKLCERLRIGAGKRVLDIGGVTGHSALFAGLGAARRGAEVTAVHKWEPVLERARARATLDGLRNIEFVNGDAAALPFPDATFDFVVSTLGLVFLPDQEAAAKELARMIKPGGQFGLMVFTRTSVPSLVHYLVSTIFDMPSQGPNHYEWSDGPRAGELLSPYFDAVSIEVDSYDNCALTTTEVLERFTKGNPNVQGILANASADQMERLRSGYLDILDRHNRAIDGTYMGPIEYAMITGVRRA